VYGNGRLVLPPSHKNYSDYLYWFHFANGTLQPYNMMLLQAKRGDPSSPAIAMISERNERILSVLDARLQKTTWLAGDDFTAADIMTVFTLTTMRFFNPVDLSAYKGILRYLERAVQREAYKKARAKADPGLELAIEGKPPKSFMEKLQAQGKI